MQANDPNIHWVEEPKLGLAGRMYLPLFMQGLSVTGRHLVSKKVTVSYPDEEPKLDAPLIYRGVHRLNKDADGRVKCVACFLCATACPAHCIDIVAEQSPWPDREKYPQSFAIDELRCIYCGMCEEACPVDAIELTSLYNLTGRSREEMIFDKEKLLSVFEATKNSEPMKSVALGGTLSSAWLLAEEVENAASEPSLLRSLVFSPLFWSMLLAAVALWLVLPRGTLRGRRAGTALSLVSLVLLIVYLPTFGNLGERVLFWLFATFTCASAVATVSMRSPVYSALSFALTLLGTAGLFLIHGAQFLGVATVVVYAGAIVVTFLFVLMLAQPEGHAFYDRISWGPLPLACASLLAALIVGGLAYTLHERESTTRYLATVLPDIQNAQRHALLAPEDVLSARLEGAEREGYFVLYLELKATENTAQVDAHALAEQLAEKAFTIAPGHLTVNVEYLDATRDALASPRHVSGLGGELFSKHLLSVEVAGTLLLAALVGAVAMIMQGRQSRPAGDPLHA